MSGSSWDMGHGRGTAEGRDMGSFRVGAGCHQCSEDGGSGSISKEVGSISVRGGGQGLPDAYMKEKGSKDHSML